MAADQDGFLTYDRLSIEHRAVAWAVVRSLATALWVGLTLMCFVWVFAAANPGGVSLWSLPPLAGAIGLAVAMEVKSRDLERPVERPASS